jgi:AraC-like DNA-binding protein
MAAVAMDRTGVPEPAVRLVRPTARTVDFVSRYAAYDERFDRPTRRNEAASCDTTIVIGFGDPVRALDLARPDPDWSVHRRFVAGPGVAPTVTEVSGVQRGLQVDLTPLGVRALLGVPAGALAGTTIELDAVLGRAGSRLVDQLERLPSWTERMAFLEQEITRRADVAPRPPPEIAWAWQRIRETRGATGIDALGASLGWSRRRLIAAFRDEFGLPPKTVARLVRLEFALRLLWPDGRRTRNIADVAYEAGYYDQAHLDRDFAEFAGATPTAYRSALPADTRHETSVQDGTGAPG